MSSAFPLPTQIFSWEKTCHEFRLHFQATRAPKTQRYCEVQVGGLIRWAKTQDVPSAVPKPAKFL